MFPGMIYMAPPTFVWWSFRGTLGFVCLQSFFLIHKIPLIISGAKPLMRAHNVPNKMFGLNFFTTKLFFASVQA